MYWTEKCFCTVAEFQRSGGVPLAISDDIYGACTSSKIHNIDSITVWRSGQRGWAEEVQATTWEGGELHTGILWEKARERICLEDLNVDGRITKFILKTRDGLHDLHSSSVIINDDFIHPIVRCVFSAGFVSDRGPTSDNIPAFP